MYRAIFVKSFRQMLTYRSEFLIGTVGNILYVYVQVCIWRALLATGMGGGVTLSQMVTYVIIAFVMRGITRSELSYTIAEKLNSGSIAIDFIRPISLMGYLFADQMSQNCFSVLVRTLPAVVVSVFAWGFSAPIDAAHLALFLVSAALAVLLMFYLEYIAGLFVFWAKNGTYTDFIIGGLFTVFSGSTIPLWFYPDWLRTVCAYLPFRLVVFEPIQIYMGEVSASRAPGIIGLQLVWLAALAALERLVWRRAKRLVFVQGG